MSLQPFSICIACQTKYKNQSSLSLHLSNSQYCIQALTNFQYQTMPSKQSKKCTILPTTQSIQQHLEHDTNDNFFIQCSIQTSSLDQDEDESISDQSFTENRTLHLDSQVFSKQQKIQEI